MSLGVAVVDQLAGVLMVCVGLVEWVLDGVLGR